jgi:hypothetical protein
MQSGMARALQADGRAINEKVRLCARVGPALIVPRETGQRSLRAVAAEIAAQGFLNERGVPFNHKSIAVTAQGRVSDLG